MTQIFLMFVLTSCVGSLLSLVLLAIKAIFKRRFTCSWYYYMWILVLLIMLIPVKIDIPMRTAADYGQIIVLSENTVQLSLADNTTVGAEPQRQIVMLARLLVPAAYIWVITAAMLFLIKIIKYVAFVKKIYANSSDFICPQIGSHTNKNVRIRKSDAYRSPLVIGVLKPVLLLPKAEISQEQLEFILAHECTHIKRRDAMYKWLISIVKCVHWFNPFIYFIADRIYLDCEISCDIAVTSKMSMPEKKRYMETLLSLAAKESSKLVPAVLEMASNKRRLKQRFKIISEKYKVGKKSRAASIAVAAITAICAVLASGMMNSRLNLSDTASANIGELQIENAELEVIADAFRGNAQEDENSVALSNENTAKETYAQPLVSRKKEKADGNSEQHSVEEIKNETAEDEGGFEQLAADTDVLQMQAELNGKGISPSDSSTVWLGKNYVVGKYSSENSLRCENNVKCDANGNITLYIDPGTENLANVRFYDSETERQIGGYEIPINGENVYTFHGFEQDKTYAVKIDGATHGEWKIDGEYIIY